MIHIDEELQNILTEWLIFLEKERRYSLHTVNAYRRDMLSFFSFTHHYFEKILTPHCLKILTIRDFRAWLAHQKKEERNPTSIARALSVLRHFMRYIEKHHALSNMAFHTLRSPKKNHTLPKSFSKEAMTRLLENTPSIMEETLEWIEARDVALMYLLYGSGLRISEALSLTKNQAEQESIKIKGKGNKERIVPLLPVIREKIAYYMEKNPYNLSGNDPIFLGLRGKVISRTYMADRITHYGKLMGFSQSISPHSFRHSFASHILQHGGEIRTIQELLGHMHLSTTQLYTEIDTEKLQKLYLNSHPRS